MEPPLAVLAALPKADLHSHIDGSVPIRELLQIARLRGKQLLTPEGKELTSASSIMSFVKGSGYHSMLDEIVTRFHPITGLMQTQEVLRDVGIAYTKELRAHNVVYAEGRFAPQYHLKEGLTYDEVIQSMQEGLAEGSERFGVKVNLIVAIGRESNQKTAEEVARAAARNKVVVALDLGGPEAGNPPERFKSAFDIATRAGLKKTVHAGEGGESAAQNLKNIRTAIATLGADRLGHAIDLAKDEELVQLAASRHVTVEMNPTSNKVLQKIRSPRELGIDRLLAKGVLVTVNSDDPALWPRGSLTEVLYAVCRAYGFGMDTVDNLVANSFDGAFINQGEKQALHEAYLAARKTLS
ncbi:MAG: adenosine deaminase [Nitrososphaerales archaeon]|nr:adenosine deaminase [Nitrososphaerales archaeon]